MNALSRQILVATVGGLGIALLALSAFHMTTLGDCGSSAGRYGSQVAGPCPGATGYWIGALAGSAMLAIALTGIAGLLLGPPFALALGGACIAALATGATKGSWLIAAGALAAIFTPIGLVGMWRARRSLTGRTLALVPPVALGAAAGAALALAIPGPLRQPKQVSFAQAESLASNNAQSWFMAANLRRALQTVTQKLGPRARISSMDLRPGIAVIDSLLGNTTHDFSLRYGGGFDDFTGTATGDETRVRVGAIDVRAPQRMLAELRRRFGIAGARVDGISLTFGVVDHAAQWEADVAGTSNGGAYHGNAHGTDVKAPE